MVLSVRSRRRMSLRVSHPLRSASNHAWPNASREYPVLGARPLTVSDATAASAVPLPAVSGLAAGFVGVGVGGGVGVAVGEGVTVRERSHRWGRIRVGVAEGVGVGGRTDEELATAGVWSVGLAVAPPTMVRTTAAPKAVAPAARVRRCAQPTRPRMRAMTATTNRYVPDRAKNPLTPELGSPSSATRHSPPQPSQLITLPRAAVGSSSELVAAARGAGEGAAALRVGAGASWRVHRAPSQYLRLPPGTGYHPA